MIMIMIMIRIRIKSTIKKWGSYFILDLKQLNIGILIY